MFAWCHVMSCHVMCSWLVGWLVGWLMMMLVCNYRAVPVGELSSVPVVFSLHASVTGLFGLCPKSKCLSSMDLEVIRPTLPSHPIHVLVLYDI